MPLRRIARIIGTLMIVAGFGSISWTITVWQWQDPFTLLYTKYEQRQLSKQYERRLATYAPVTRTRRQAQRQPTLSERMEALALDARGYRLAVSQGDAIGRIKAPRLGLNMILANGTDTPAH